jgi:hypothetical protein
MLSVVCPKGPIGLHTNGVAKIVPPAKNSIAALVRLQQGTTPTELPNTTVADICPGYSRLGTL